MFSYSVLVQIIVKIYKKAGKLVLSRMLSGGCSQRTCNALSVAFFGPYFQLITYNMHTTNVLCVLSCRFITFAPS